MLMVTKLAHLQKNYNRLQPLKLHDLMLLTWQIDTSLSLDLWSLNLAGCWLQGVFQNVNTYVVIDLMFYFV